jgi:hypothetical protein
LPPDEGQVWLGDVELAGLCEEEDLPALLPLLRAEQQICADRFDRARWRLNKESRFGHLGPSDGSEGRGRLLHALMADDALIWGNRALRLKNLLLALEGHDDVGGFAFGAVLIWLFARHRRTVPPRYPVY